MAEAWERSHDPSDVPAGADPDPPLDAFDWSRPPMSAQARWLHVRCVAVSAEAGTPGLIGRAEATRLADECEALMDELVEAGYWRESDLSYELLRGQGSPEG